MGLVSGFQDGLIFVSDLFFQHQGAYSCAPKKPCVCDKCLSRSGCFHAHGRYRRWVKTLKEFARLGLPVLRAHHEHGTTPDVLPTLLFAPW